MITKNIPDLWDGCYDGEQQKRMPPKQFREVFCAQCLNSGCRNSKAAGLKWVQRMLTQEDILLDNPQYADPDDPRYRMVAAQDFQDMIKHALAIEISTQKGDWSVPTEKEIGVAAAEMVGIIPPSGYKAPEEAPVSTPEEAAEEAPIEAAEEAAVKAPPVGQWRIRGDSGKAYTVTQQELDKWDCTCPSLENPCKHARDIAKRLERAPTVAPVASPSNPTRPSGPASFVPRSLNTASPNSGIMVDGGAHPTASPQDDPWAPPANPQERVIPIGGRVTFGRGKK